MRQDSRSDKRPYRAPTLEDFGTIAELTECGWTNPGGDTFPGRADTHPQHDHGGSITHNSAC